MVTQRKPIFSIELGAIRRWMKQGLIEQIREVATDKTLICTVWIRFTNFQLIKHVLEHPS